MNVKSITRILFAFSLAGVQLAVAATFAQAGGNASRTQHDLMIAGALGTQSSAVIFKAGTYASLEACKKAVEGTKEFPFGSQSGPLNHFLTGYCIPAQ